MSFDPDKIFRLVASGHPEADLDEVITLSEDRLAGVKGFDMPEDEREGTRYLIDKLEKLRLTTDLDDRYQLILRAPL
jgi:hypothetical protein